MFIVEKLSVINKYQRHLYGNKRLKGVSKLQYIFFFFLPFSVTTFTTGVATGSPKTRGENVYHSGRMYLK